MSEWRVDRVERFGNVTLETLRQRSGPGAHRLRIGDRTLLVGADEATTGVGRARCIRGHLARHVASANPSPASAMWGCLDELKKIGAYHFEYDGKPWERPSKQGRTILAMLAGRKQSGPALNKTVNRFGARIHELRRLGYPIVKERIDDDEKLEGQFWYWLERGTE